MVALPNVRDIVLIPNKFPYFYHAIYCTPLEYKVKRFWPVFCPIAPLRPVSGAQ
jgi:hypothetical protein